MGRVQKLKLENIKKANELLDKGHRLSIENKKQVFKPSDNVTNNPKSFVDKMKNLSEGTRCWKGYEKKGMKTMFGKRVPNCVKKEEVEEYKYIGNPTKHINEEPEEDTYYVITKAERQDLINMGGTAKEIAKALPSYDKFKPN